MFRNDGKTGSVSVQSVTAPENERFVLLLVIPCKSICHRVGVIIHGRVDRHSGGLVNNNDILIFIYNIKWKKDGRNLFRTVIFLYADGKSVSGLQCVTHIAVLSIDKDTFRHTFDLSEVL